MAQKIALEKSLEQKTQGLLDKLVGKDLSQVSIIVTPSSAASFSVGHIDVHLVFDTQIETPTSTGISSLVVDLLGIRSDRGDTLTVTTAPFAPTWRILLGRYSPYLLWALATSVLLAALAFVAFLVVSKPISKGVIFGSGQRAWDVFSNWRLWATILLGMIVWGAFDAELGLALLTAHTLAPWARAPAGGIVVLAGLCGFFYWRHVGLMDNGPAILKGSRLAAVVLGVLFGLYVLIVIFAVNLIRIL